MFTSWQFTLLALPQILATLLAAAAAGAVWRWRGEATGARWLTGVLVAATWWSAVAVLELLAVNLGAKILFSQLSYVGVLAGPLCFAEFTHRYINPGQPLPRRWARPLRVIAGLLLLIVFTQPWHQQLWSAVRLVDRGTLVTAHYERAIFFWVVVGYAYGVLLAGAFTLLRHSFNVAGIFRSQSMLIVGATLAPLTSSLVYLFRLGPLPELDPTPLGFVVTGLLLFWAVHRVRLFALTPVAATMLFERMRDPLVLTDLGGQLIQANPMAMRRLGLAPTAIGRPLPEAITDLPLREAFTLAARRPQTVKVADVWWDIEASHLRDEAGHRRARLYVLRNITRQKNDELELRETTRAMREALARADALAHSASEANAAKTRFLAQMSHDLRTPLHGIIGMAEIMAGRYDEPRLREEIDTIREAGQSLLRLINDLLDLSRIESGRADLARHPFQLDEVLDPVADLLSVAAERKGLFLLTSLAPDFDGGLRGDPDWLRRILMNLGGNAVKFTTKGHVIIRAARTTAGLLQLEISDTGPGIEPERLTSIFEAFDRGSPEIARTTEGTGLGLAITHRLVEAMGGAIHATSEPGQGTTFTVELPLLDPTATTADSNPLPHALADRRVSLAASLSPPAVRDCLMDHLRCLGAKVVSLTEKSDLVIGLEPAQVGSAGRQYRQVRPPFKRRQLAALLGEHSPAHPSRPTLVSSPAPATARPTLLADDDALARRVSTALLQRAGCAVTAVNGGRHALEELARTPFEVIVLDGQMGDYDGWDVVKHLRMGRAGELNRHAPVIALSADLTAEAKKRWEEGGVTAILSKPLQVNKLQACLDALPKPAAGTPPDAP